MQGCPFDCVFCNQRHITGQYALLTDDAIAEKIESHLSTLAVNNRTIEIGFFGGSFTGLNLGEQEHYLKLVQPWIKSGKVSGIRLSTRPDYISEEILSMLKYYHVKSVELGVQSMDDEVLQKSGRGHSSFDVRNASELIRNYGFSLGLQMMVGLPGDTFQKTEQTTREIIAMSANSTRIYPAVVIRNTNLELQYRQGIYTPLSLKEAVDWCSRIVPLFEIAGVKILRLGLHPSEGLLHGDDLIAGPFHVAFGEMVYSNIWMNILSNLHGEPTNSISICVNPGQINHAIGHKAGNRKMLEKRFGKVIFKADESLCGREFRVSLQA